MRVQVSAQRPATLAAAMEIARDWQLAYFQQAFMQPAQPEVSVHIHTLATPIKQTFRVKIGSLVLVSLTIAVHIIAHPLQDVSFSVHSLKAGPGVPIA